MKKTEHTSPDISMLETHWEMAAKTRMGKYLTEVETVFIKKAVDFSKTTLVLDVGAESGRISLIALNTKTNVVSIDIDGGSLKRLRQRTKQAIVVVADARYLPFKSDVFDAAFMVEVLDYIPELGVALDDCYRVLKFGSNCVLSFGNRSSFKGKLKSLGGGRSYLHSCSGVIQILPKAGFCLHAHLGFNWLPFGRTSQSGLVPIFAWLERVFRLRKLCRYSPWVICHVIKQLNNP
ncbi:MAG: class I SAM-dependent methyltransferase [Candidatus Bathyarchaeota archaeon]|nr:class I SAM-dependent methyltransferase [Candidatus Termiticorpusculum sp.]MCL1970781.1 class I SAM-dependent methyltransferase [Candidatus Termiticorpusculum sp.]